MSIYGVDTLDHFIPLDPTGLSYQGGESFVGTEFATAEGGDCL